MKNYYKILEIEKGAEKEEVRKAYRTLSKKYHPDTSKGDDNKFKEIQEAYSVLSDDKKRKKYDMGMDPDTPDSAFSGGQGPFGGFGVNFGFGDDIFEEVFRRYNMNFDGSGPFQSRRPRAKNGGDVKVELRLGLKDVFTGKKVEIPLRRKEFENNSYVEKQRTFKLDIKKGFIPGKPIVLHNEGHQGMNGGRNGNVVIIPTLRKHEFFEQRNAHLFCTITLTIPQIILGDTVKIKNIDDEVVNVEVPTGSKDGDSIEIRGKGLPVSETSRGKLIVRIKAEYPKDLTHDQIYIIESLGKTLEKKNEFNF